MRMSYTPFHTTNARANQRINSRFSMRVIVDHDFRLKPEAASLISWLPPSGGRLSAVSQHQRGDVVVLRSPLGERPNVGENRLQHFRGLRGRVLLSGLDDARFAVLFAGSGQCLR